MRVDRLGPRTWLLAGAAGWAVLLWVLTLFGLGGRLGKADDEGQTRKLPTTDVPAAIRPGAPGQYTAIWNQPLFSESRQPVPFTITGEGDAAQANPFDFTLISVLIARDVQIAILKPATDGAEPVRVKVGEAVETAPQWMLASVEPRQAIFRGPEGEKRLELRVFDGVGGSAATPMASTQPAGTPVQGQGGVPQPGMPQPGMVQAGPMPPPPEANPGIVPPPPPTPVVTSSPSTDAQLEAIRKRIEERRAQLRQQAAQDANSPGQPGQTH